MWSKSRVLMREIVHMEERVVEFRGAHAPRHRELFRKRLFRRAAETSPRGACTTQIPLLLVSALSIFSSDHQFESGPDFVHRADLYVHQTQWQTNVANHVLRDSG